MKKTKSVQHSRQEGIIGIVLLILLVTVLLVIGLLYSRLNQSSKPTDTNPVRFQNKQFFDNLDTSLSSSIMSLGNDATTHQDKVTFCTNYNQTVNDNGDLGCTIAYALYVSATDDNADTVANSSLQLLEAALNSNKFDGTLARVEAKKLVVDGKNTIFLETKKDTYYGMKYAQYANCQSTVEYPIRLKPPYNLPERKNAISSELYITISCTALALDNVYEPYSASFSNTPD